MILLKKIPPFISDFGRKYFSWFLPEKRRISKKMQLLVTIEHGLQPANLEFTVVFRCVVISYFCEHTTEGGLFPNSVEIVHLRSR